MSSNDLEAAANLGAKLPPTDDRIDHHFRTEHLMADIKGRSVRGGVVTLAAQGVKFTLQMGSTMILARLLTPADFGLVAMVTAVTGFVTLFKDAGLSMATVQREHITHAQVSTLFWINVGLSIVVMISVAAFAPLIAWFYGDPRLTTITLALAATFIFGGFTAQHQALLRRQMRFKDLATIEILSMAAGIATAIAMAWQGFEYWALVGMSAGNATANCALVWILSGWRPGLPVRGSGVGTMLRFGGGLTGFSFLNYFTRNADNVIIGYALGGTSLGVYSKAYGLLMMPIQQINGPIASVALPALSALQHNDTAYRKFFMRAIGLMTSLSMPLVAFALLEANSFVYLVLGPQWIDATKVFLALGPAALIGTFNVAPGWLFVTKGRTFALFKYSIFAAPLTVAAFLIGVQWGVIGVAWSFSVVFTLCYIAIIPLSCKDTAVYPSDYVTSMWRPAAGCALASTLVIIAHTILSVHSPVLSVVLSGTVFSTAYAVFWLLVPDGRKQLTDLLTIFRNPAPARG